MIEEDAIIDGFLRCSTLLYKRPLYQIDWCLVSLPYLAGFVGTWVDTMEDVFLPVGKFTSIFLVVPCPCNTEEQGYLKCWWISKAFKVTKFLCAIWELTIRVQEVFVFAPEPTTDQTNRFDHFQYGYMFGRFGFEVSFTPTWMIKLNQIRIETDDTVQNWNFLTQRIKTLLSGKRFNCQLWPNLLMYSYRSFCQQ